MLRTTDGTKDKWLTADDILHVPAMADNLISVSKLTDSGLDVIFSGDECKVFSGKHLVTSALKEHGIYKLWAQVLSVTGFCLLQRIVLVPSTRFYGTVA